MKNRTEFFRFCQKYQKKLLKSSRILERFQSGDISAAYCPQNDKMTKRQKNNMVKKDKKDNKDKEDKRTK